MPGLSRLDRLAELTDPRSGHGRQYQLVPLLTPCLVATLAGCTAIAPFGRLRKHRLGHALGFRTARGPVPTRSPTCSPNSTPIMGTG